MKCSSFAIAIIFGQLLLVASDDCPKKDVVACYYSSWSIYRQEEGRFTINDIDPTLCTHLIYSFAGLDINTRISSLDPNNDITNGGYTTFTALKEKNPCLKTLLAIGGWNEGSIKYSIMTSTPESIDAFVEGALRLVGTYNFDGLDVDWEYPTQRGGIPEDKDNFIKLLKKLRDRLEKWGLLLTIAVPLSSTITESSYDIEQINDIVDHVFLMAYDYTAVTSPQTGWLSPMTPIREVVDIWLKHLDSEKLILGLPTYARSFKLLDESDNGLGAATNGTGIAGPFTRQAGFLAYYELVAYLDSGKYEPVLDDGTFYASYHTNWFSFDLPESYQEKVKYAKSQNLGGVMVWSIDTDDFSGNFSGTPYPILNAIYEVLDSKQ